MTMALLMVFWKQKYSVDLLLSKSYRKFFFLPTMIIVDDNNFCHFSVGKILVSQKIIKIDTENNEQECCSVSDEKETMNKYRAKKNEEKNTSEKNNKHWSIESWPTFVLHQHLHINDTNIFRFE